jgi:signal transduction histidine kinase/ligand-binding sensor domain-containing protein/DNA-binding response OmpR family regulator
MFSVANNAISRWLNGSDGRSCIFKTSSATKGRLLLAYVVFFTFVSTGAFAQSEQFKFKHLSIKDELSHPEVRAIFKDSRGFIWVATGSGLNRFDGYVVKSFLNDPRDTTSIIDNLVLDLFETPDGTIGVVTSGGLTLYHPDKENFQRNLESFYLKYGTSRNLKNIERDVDGAFWFVEPDKLIRYTSKDQKSISIQNLEGESSSIAKDPISNFTIDQNGNRWLVHTNGIIEKIEMHNGEGRVVRRITSVSEFNNYQQTDYGILCDADGDIWICGSSMHQGALYYSLKDNTLHHFSTNSKPVRLSANSISGFIEAQPGKIWIGTDHGGINIVDKKQWTVQYIRHEDGDEMSLSENSVICLYKDDQGIIWLGTYKRGVSYYHANIYPFDLYKHYSLDPGSLPFEDINRFAEDDKGNLWIGTNGGGLLYFDRKSGKFKQYQNEPGNPNSISGNVIVSLCVDSDQNLWIGTFKEGLNKFDGKKFIRFKNIPGDTTSLPSQNIWEIFEDSRKRLWIGTLDVGAAQLDKKTGNFHRLRLWGPNAMQSVTIDAIGEDRHGNIWFGTSQGIDVLSADQRIFTHYGSSSDPKSLSNNIVLDIELDSKGRLWLATYDGLNLFDESKKEFRVFRENPKNNAVLTIQEDNFGNLWLSTLNGLSEMTFVNNSLDSVSYKRHTESDGLQGRQFNLNAGFRTRRGELVFGGPTGFNIFSGGEHKEVPPLRKIFFSDLELYEKSVAIGEQVDGVVILKKSITETKEIVLPPNKHFFSIKFSALNYFNPDRDQYMYKLEGLNSDWLPVDAKSHEIVFNGLNPGHYTLKVKAANSDGVWIDNEATLEITIQPPFWKTNTAFALYVGLLIGILFVARRLIQQREKLKFALEEERREIQHIHELDMMKVKFFTNVSHEFRTPLTLILTPIERLIKKATDPDQIIQFQLIQRNGKRLMKLVNQLLDFKKLEVHEIKFVPSKGDIIEFVRDAVFSFSDLSEKKHIKLSFETSVEHLETLFDQDKLEKILFNLLSNAIKFTLENGVVSVKLSVLHEGEEKFIQIDVQDTGIGIQADKLDKIFEPFFQNELPKSIVNIGSGIGLSITKEFVRIQGGRITVNSEVGKGSCFSVLLPVPDIDMTTAQVQEEVVQSDSFTPTEDVSDLQEAVQADDIVEKQIAKTKRKSLLLVEDNDDFRFYLKDNLKFLYTIHEARNGVEGWNQVLSVQPDLIVSDIMMPEMNGIELCTKLKSDERVSHIPVILLTARSSEEQRLEGFKTGADDYITKPFNFEVLEARINNLLRQREKSQKSFRKTLDVKSSELQITPLDVKFIENAVKSVEKNISSQDFSVEDLGVELGISRAYVFRKILALTGKTPLEFIRTIRLQHAAQLLEKSQLSVREVAYKVGFNNPKYFTKYFKEQFHVLPSEYVTLKKKEE